MPLLLCAQADSRVFIICIIHTCVALCIDEARHEDDIKTYNVLRCRWLVGRSVVRRAEIAVEMDIRVCFSRANRCRRGDVNGG
jgi:hypothetical protein